MPVMPAQAEQLLWKIRPWMAVLACMTPKQPMSA